MGIPGGVQEYEHSDGWVFRVSLPNSFFGANVKSRENPVVKGSTSWSLVKIKQPATVVLLFV